MTKYLQDALWIVGFWCICAAVAYAQGAGVGPAPGIELLDEGVTQGRIQKLNCAGSGVTCTKSGVTGTATISGGSGTFAVTETEIDFGDGSVAFFGTFTVTDAAVTASHMLLVVQSGEAPTGKEQDENELDWLVLRAVAGTGEFTLYVQCPESCHGKFKINYTFA